MHAMRAEIHSTLGSSPAGSLVFNRDKFLNIPLIADWHAITQKREHLIHEPLMQENQKRRQYDYLPEQRVLKKHWKPRKLDKRTSGPYRVIQTYIRHSNYRIETGSLRETEHAESYSVQRMNANTYPLNSPAR
jgi:hypothetical protein